MEYLLINGSCFFVFDFGVSKGCHSIKLFEYFIHYQCWLHKNIYNILINKQYIYSLSKNNSLTVNNSLSKDFWSEHNNLDHSQNWLNTFKRNIDHVFNWKILCPAPSEKHPRKNLEAIFIALCKLLNNQKSFDRLMFFRNGITWFLFEMMGPTQRIDIVKYDIDTYTAYWKNIIDIFMQHW